MKFKYSVLMSAIMLMCNSAHALTWNDYGEAYTHDRHYNSVRAPQYDRDTGNRRYDDKPARSGYGSNYGLNPNVGYNPNIPGSVKGIQPQVIIKSGTY